MTTVVPKTGMGSSCAAAGTQASSVMMQASSVIMNVARIA
jgi:hypothetical protein